MWFDRDKAVSSAKRSASTSTLELKQKLEKQISDAKQAMAEFENPLYAGMFMNEKAVAKKGLDGLEAVLGDDESALQAYIGSFDEELGASGKKTIGKAPPCRNYADLLLISKIQGKIDSYDYCADEERRGDLDQGHRHPQEAHHLVVGCGILRACRAEEGGGAAPRQEEGQGHEGRQLQPQPQEKAEGRAEG